jgi:hypothetical protein
MTQVQFQVTLRPTVCRPVRLGAGKFLCLRVTSSSRCRILSPISPMNRVIQHKVKVTLVQGKMFNVTIGTAEWEACSATWNLGTNSVFALGPRHRLPYMSNRPLSDPPSHQQSTSPSKMAEATGLRFDSDMTVAASLSLLLLLLLPFTHSFREYQARRFTAFWFVTWRNLVFIYRRFRGKVSKMPRLAASNSR